MGITASSDQWGLSPNFNRFQKLYFRKKCLSSMPKFRLKYDGNYWLIEILDQNQDINVAQITAVCKMAKVSPTGNNW